MIIPTKRGAFLWHAAAVLAVTLGVAFAASRFPGGYDWTYTVISRLGSHTQNPDGARWLAASLMAAVLCLWPVVNHLESSFSRSRACARFSIAALRVALLGGALLAVEGLLNLQFSRQLDKAHEAVALVTFVAFYTGLLGLCSQRFRRGLSFLPALLILLPLCAAGLSKFVLYLLSYADGSWADPTWRELGMPFYLSFAFWQWLAVAALAAGLGYLVGVGPQQGLVSEEKQPRLSAHSAR